MFKISTNVQSEIGTRSTVVKEPTLFVRLKMNMLKLSSVITSGAILVRQFLLNTFAEELKLFIKAITTPSKLDSKHHTNNTNTNTNTNNNNNNNNNNNSSSSSSTFLFDASISID
ncbi:hypothetical protein T4B_8321 [Trichinella pseudospiralis]|uniref:Uncharacterized protein n=1 Tax=Trichinella pseudospiralis TaxID=6337 RepID=A0A0V1HDI7_TRIPS|nr:hypothetical protein T4B_8321 [Trichinella pseudospiralis]